MYVQGKSCRELSPPSAATKKKPMHPNITKSLVLTTARLKESWSFMAGLLTRLLFHFVLLFLLLFLQNSKAALVCAMNIMMASMCLMRFTNLLLLFNLAAAAMGRGYIGPTPTSGDLVKIQIQSMAPRPTRSPSMDDNTEELRKRRLPDSIYSRIPKSWCAFANGNFGKSERIISSSHNRLTKQSPYTI